MSGPGEGGSGAASVDIEFPEGLADCQAEAAEAPPPLGMVCRYSDIFPRVVIDEDTPHPAAVAALEPELPLARVARALGRTGLQGAVVATLAAYLWTTRRFSAAAAFLWLLGALAWAVGWLLRDRFELDEQAQALVLVRSLGGVETREAICGFGDLAAITVTGHPVAATGGSGHGTTWLYEVVAVTTSGQALPLSARFEEAPGVANQAARVVAAKTGAPFEEGKAYQVLALDVDPEAGAMLVRHEPGEGRASRDTPTWVARAGVLALLVLAAL